MDGDNQTGGEHFHFINIFFIDVFIQQEITVFFIQA